MEKYINIAKAYLKTDSRHLVKGLCFTVRKKELDNSNNPEELIKEKLSFVYYDFSAVKSYTDSYGINYLMFFNEPEEDNAGKEYEAIEDILTERISSDTVSNIEKFLGYSISADVLENIEDRIREVLDQMPEEEILLYEKKYLTQ